MKLALKIYLLLLFSTLCTSVMAQVKHSVPLPASVTDTVQVSDHPSVDKSDQAPLLANDTTVRKQVATNDYQHQLDLIDVLRMIANKHAKPRNDSSAAKSKKLHISAVPAAGYTLQTGFAVLAVANGAFYTDTSSNVSSVLTSLTYTQRKQIILPLQTNIWTKNNKYNIVVDWRYLKYPSFTYGLGGYTTLQDQYTIDYSAVRLHQTIYRHITDKLYVGVGYNFDYYWNIKELDPPNGTVTDFEKYGLSNTETGSGPTLNVLYDSRTNSINPESGTFANVIYRPNLAFLGNDDTWRSLVVDLRKYFKFPESSNNVLAIWNYDWLTLSGNPPYLLLPSTGNDPYSNTGRGYIQSRYRGKNMLYLESEYRFQLTHNGLLGGVVFVNAQSFSEQNTNQFSVISPGYGAGLRIRLNKFSRTNVALDYGFDKTGAGGLFVNLGEVF